MRKFSMLVVILVLSLSVATPALGQGGGDGGRGDGGDDETPRQSIAEIVTEAAESPDPEFTILLAALEESGLLAALDERGPFTVFAPTDAAFERFFAARGLTPTDVLADNELLARVLLYHIVPGTLQAADLGVVANRPLLTALPQAALRFSVLPEGAFVDRAAILATDILATNGVVHVIEDVLVPADDEGTLESRGGPGEISIADFLLTLAFDPDQPQFTLLLQAARTAGVLETFQNPDTVYTVFAPTDAAFRALLAEMGVSFEELAADVELLRLVLSYHVLPLPVFAEDVVALENAAAGTLLDGSVVSVRVSAEGDVFVNGARVIAADIIATNGVVHVINEVLVPARMTTQPPDRRNDRGSDGR